MSGFRSFEPLASYAPKSGARRWQMLVAGWRYRSREPPPSLSPMTDPVYLIVLLQRGRRDGDMGLLVTGFRVAGLLMSRVMGRVMGVGEEQDLLTRMRESVRSAVA